eukprot:TRINITY_DN1143_c4_g1_i1.p1 TRINITY_DN1143_c4_g1~~TRINITY_DN1143_c4_g1_i1.p1  ORF type:complete len:749 (+),score=130.98 TRINITY_DN1143_c4_g1_i1:49-2247(+)
METDRLLNFNRVDMTAMSSMNRGCLKVIPRAEGKGKRQKVVVADTSGLMNYLQIDSKTAEVKVVFKATSQKGFASLDLDGDKVFTASGDTLRAFNKKGTEYFKVETNLTEPIKNIAVKTPWIWTSGEYVVAAFEEGAEAAYLNSPDHVNDLLMARVVSDKEYNAIVACQDRTIRVIQGSSVVYTEPCEGGVMTIHEVVHAAGSKSKQESREIVYGTANGFIGSFKVTPGGLAKYWARDDTGKGGITAIHSSDVSSEGIKQLIVGKDDGNLEIYGTEVGSDVPDRRYQTTVNESIQGIGAGSITQVTTEDIVIGTYTGKVICYSAEAKDELPMSIVGSKATSHAKAKQISQANAEKKKRLQALEDEAAKMKDALSQKKDDYSKLSSACVAVTATHSVQDKFVLESTASWALTIAIDAPIDTVAIVSDVEIELLDTDNNACIVSTTKPDAPHAKLLASYRCTESTSRIEMKVRTVEGQHGTLSAYVIPFLTPKTCQLVQYDIKPLSLHQRLNEAPEIPSCAINMKMEGAFAVNDMHAWVRECLPEIPAMLHDEKVTYYFTSTFLGTILKIHYRNNEAHFVSDSISTLTVLWDYIGKAATAKKVKLASVNLETANLDEACTRVLHLLHPKLSHQLGLTDKVALLSALKEIEMQEQDVSFLSEEYRECLKNSFQLEKELALRPKHLEFLYNLVQKLFLDKYRAKGQNPQHKVPVLMQRLQQQQYSLEGLIEFFKTG